MGPKPTYAELEARVAALEAENARLTGAGIGREAPRFEDLFDIEEIQRLQDAFAEAVGVASLITTPDGRPITRPTRFCRLCRDIIRKSPAGLANCMRSDAVIVRHSPDGPTLQPCLSGGLWDGGASISAGGTHIANWLVGQVRNEAQDIERMRAYARQIGADEAEFIAALEEVPVMPVDQFRRVCQALFLMANQMSRIAHQNILKADLIQRLEATHRMLAARDLNLATLLQSLGDGVIATDESGRINLINPVAERLAGWSGEAAVGRALSEVFHVIDAETDEGDAEMADRIIRERWTERAEGRSLLAARDGARHPVAYSATPITVTNGETGGMVVVFRDVSDEVRFKAELERSEARYRAMFDSMKNGVAVYRAVGDGEDFIFLDFNRAAEEMDGSRREDIIGRSVREAFPGVVGFGLFDVFASVYRTGEPRHHPVSMYKDERLQAWRDNYVYRLPSGEIVSIYSDETARKKAEEALEIRNRDLERSNNELQQFAYVASHDLQEPLRMVSSYTQLLARRYQGRLDKDADEFIHYAVDGARRMQVLINDLLAFSRVDTKGRPFSLTPAGAVVENVIRTLKLTIEETGAVIAADPLPEVMADESQLTQLFQNLIGNALKFRGAAPPRIHVSARREAAEWVFSVADNGIGVEERFYERIFIIFQRLHGKTEYPGTGIGLAICRKIAERHGGRIWLESRPGAGATFYFTMPIPEE